MSFRFRKLYADAVLSDGSVVVAYLAWLDCVGMHSASAAIEWYSADGTRTALHAFDPPSPLDPDAATGRLSIELATATGDFSLEYSSRSGDWAPSGPDGLCWRVLQARADTVVKCMGARGTKLSYGSGYVDWVELSRPPRLLHLRALAWGRAHWSDGAAVYTTVLLASGHRWTRAARWQGRDLAETRDHMRFEHVPGGALVAAAGDATWLRLGNGRILHQGDGLDRERFPRLLDRVGARLLTGTIDETRWFCPVLVPTFDRDGSVAIHERVHFGRRSAQRWRTNES